MTQNIVFPKLKPFVLDDGLICKFIFFRLLQALSCKEDKDAIRLYGGTDLFTSPPSSNETIMVNEENYHHVVHDLLRNCQIEKKNFLTDSSLEYFPRIDQYPAIERKFIFTSSDWIEGTVSGWPPGSLSIFDVGQEIQRRCSHFGIRDFFLLDRSPLGNPKNFQALLKDLSDKNLKNLSIDLYTNVAPELNDITTLEKGPFVKVRFRVTPHVLLENIKQFDSFLQAASSKIFFKIILLGDIASYSNTLQERCREIPLITDRLEFDSDESGFGPIATMQIISQLEKGRLKK